MINKANSSNAIYNPNSNIRMIKKEGSNIYIQTGGYQGRYTSSYSDIPRYMSFQKTLDRLVMNNNIQKVQPMMPMPMPMPVPMSMYPIPNPMVMQTLYHQDLMRQKEIQQLDKNYEYQLMRQKYNEQFKVVDDKKGKNK